MTKSTDEFGIENEAPKQPDLWIDVRSIYVEDSRARSDFSYVKKLKDSIEEHGLINPVCVSAKPDGRYKLLAGEQRFRAMGLLQWAKIPCFVKHNLSELEEFEIELEENVTRKNLTWTEETELEAKIAEVKAARREQDIARAKAEGTPEPKPMTQADIAAQIGKSQQAISQQIALAKIFKDRPDIKAQVQDLPKRVAIREVKKILKTERLADQASRGTLKVEANLSNISLKEGLLEIPDESIDLIVTDPPFGYGDINERGKNKGSESASYTSTIQPTDNLTLDEANDIIEVILRQAARILKPTSHFYIFMSIESYPHVRSVLSELPQLDIQHSPLIWNKDNNTTPFGGYNYMNSYELLIYGWKVPKKRALRKAEKDILTFKPIPSKQKIHAFQKPPALLELLISQSSDPGDTVLDPCAGSGSTLVTALQLGRKARGFEVNEKNYLNAMDCIAEAEKLLKNKPIDKDEL